MDVVIPKGKMPHPDDRDLAHLAHTVYRPDSSGFGRWTRLRPDDLAQRGIEPENLEDKDSGFRAAIFTDGTCFVVAFAGTDEWREVVTNIAQSAGKETAQYASAFLLGRLAKSSFGEKLCFTGHSLGGGLAALAACATDTLAVTFNAAGLHTNSYVRIGLDAEAARSEAASGLVRAYAVEGEILTRVQERLPIPKAPGSPVRVADPEPPTGFRSALPISRAIRSIRLHSMATVVKAVEADSRFRNPPPEATALLNKADAVLAKSGLSDRSIERVRTALERRVATEVAANRFPPSAPVKDQGRSR